MIQVLSEKKINIEQLSLQHDEPVSQNQWLEQVVDYACKCIPKLAIPADLPAVEWIHRLVTDIREGRAEKTKV